MSGASIYEAENPIYYPKTFEAVGISGDYHDPGFECEECHSACQLCSGVLPYAKLSHV